MPGPSAVPVRLTHATLVVGEDRDAVLDERGDDRPVVQPRLLTASMYPHDGWMPPTG